MRAKEDESESGAGPRSGSFNDVHAARELITELIELHEKLKA